MALSDTGLVVRYYIDEASSGTTPTQLEDASSNNYDLTSINYGAGNMAYNEVSGNRGLDSTTISGNQQAKRAVNDTSDAVRDAIVGSKTATLEIVVRLDDIGTGSGNRVWGLFVNAATRGRIGIATAAPSAVDTVNIDFNGALMEDKTGLVDATRHVIHVVYDTAVGTAADRVLLYIDGVLTAPTNTYNTAVLNETISLPASTELVGINHSAGWGQPFDGMLFYAALYSVAFDSTRITDHYNVLNADDDTPVSGRTLHLVTSPLRW